MNKEEIGIFIKELREEKGMTQEELAAAIYCSRSNLAHIESGRVFPSHDKILSLAKILGVSETEIYSGKKLKSKEELNLATYKIMRYFDTKYKRTIIGGIVLIVLCLLFLFGYYFFNSYKTIKMYNISGESENYTVNSGLLLISKQKLLLDLKVESKNNLNVKKIALKYKTKDKDELVVETDSSDLYIGDFYKYNAYFDYYSISKNKGIFYIEIFNDDKMETLNLTLKQEFVNDYIKPKSEIPIIDEKHEQKEPLSVPTKIKDEFTLDDNGIYTYAYKANDVDYSISYDPEGRIFTVLEGNSSYTKSWIYYLDVENLVYSYSKNSKIIDELDFVTSSMNKKETKIYNEFKSNYFDKYCE